MRQTIHLSATGICELERRDPGVTIVSNGSLPGWPRPWYRGHTQHTPTSHTTEGYADWAPGDPPRNVGLIACHPFSPRAIPFRDKLGEHYFATGFAYFVTHVKGTVTGAPDGGAICDSPTPGAATPIRKRRFDARGPVAFMIRANANDPTTVSNTESRPRGLNN